VEPKRLYLSNDKVLGGVCGGIAEFFNVDPTLVRLLWVLFTLLHGIGLLLYLVALFIIPANPHKSDNSREIGTTVRDSWNRIVDRTRPNHNSESSRNRILGLVLLAVGAVLLLLKIAPRVSWQIVWSLLFIGLGLFLIVKSD